MPATGAVGRLETPVVAVLALWLRLIAALTAYTPCVDGSVGYLDWRRWRSSLDTAMLTAYK